MNILRAVVLTYVLCQVLFFVLLTLAACEPPRPVPVFGPGLPLAKPHQQDLDQCAEQPTSVFCQEMP